MPFTWARNQGVTIITIDEIKEMVTRLKIPYDVVSDIELKFTTALDLPIFKIENLVFIKRLTLIIERAIIKKVFYPIFPPDLHIHEVLEWLRKN